jgi:hypothetical protein
MRALSSLRIAFAIASSIAALALIVACGEDAGEAARAVEPSEAATPDAPVDPELDGGAAPDAAAPIEAAVDAAYGPAVACGTVLPGPPLAANVTEAESDYALRLAAIDTSVLPEVLDLSAKSTLVRGVVRYALESSVDVHSRSKLAAQGKLGAAVLGAIAKAGATGTDIDFGFLRQGLHYFSPCARPLPPDLATLRARYGDYKTWARIDIACAKPKNGPRIVYENAGAGVFVAETVADGGAVRETEALFTKTRTDGQIDFAAYTAEGKLTDRSTFATNTSSITSSSPYTCMSCHVSAGKFDVLFPSGTGAGCP